MSENHGATKRLGRLACTNKAINASALPTGVYVWTSGNRGQVIRVHLHRGLGIVCSVRGKGAHHDQLCRPGRFTEDHDSLHY